MEYRQARVVAGTDDPAWLRMCMRRGMALESKVAAATTRMLPEPIQPDAAGKATPFFLMCPADVRRAVGLTRPLRIG